jgi:hypothetical protein
MFENQSSHSRTEAPRLSTTLLAIAWGITSAYILFYSLLVSHSVRPCLAALVPLVITWATLERKRWGRLALLGLSCVALGLFVGTLGLSASVVHATLPAAEQTPLRCLTMALGYFGEKSPLAGGVIVALAAMTGFYLRRPNVTAEFEQGKKQTMALAQKGIAAVLVGSWGLTFIGAPLPNKIVQPSASVLLLTARHHSGATSHTSSKRSARSVASSNNP